jgi:iron complex transport system substrate-binding protein
MHVARLLIIAGTALAMLATPWTTPTAGAADEPTQRILSIGGDVTEILYDLGAQDKVVAVDTTSLFPPDALKTKKSVGYMRALSAEGALSVNPTLIIASDGAGPAEVVRALKNSGVRYAEILNRPSPAGVPDKIRQIGSIIKAEAAAKILAEKVEGEFASLDRARSLLKTRKRVLFILTIQNGHATVGGKGTAANSIIALAGADNVAADLNGYKPVSDEQLTEFAPDAVVVMRRGGDDQHTAGDALKLTGLSQSPAVKSQSVISMDALYLLGFGPRAPLAARDLMNALYPGNSQAAAAP